jgi:uncharacterized repeat protein (TIGR03843 family)
MQLFVESEPIRSIRELEKSRDLDLARIAAFDFVTNNADRKAGHVLRDGRGQLWGIDQGLCFNVVPKVRTVLLHFCGEPIPAPVLTELKAFRQHTERCDGLAGALGLLLDCDEVDAFMRRVDWLLERGVYPSLDPYRNVPWPPF